MIYVQANCYTNLYKFAIYNDHSYYEFMANNEVSLILDLPLGTTYIFQYYSSLSTVSWLFYNNFAKKFLQIPYKHITNYGYNKVFFLRSLEIRYINKFCCTCLRHLSIHIWYMWLFGETQIQNTILVEMSLHNIFLICPLIKIQSR